MSTCTTCGGMRQVLDRVHDQSGHPNKFVSRECPDCKNTPPKSTLEAMFVNAQRTLDASRANASGKSRDGQYASMISQTQEIARRRKDLFAQSEHWRVQAKNAVGKDNVDRCQQMQRRYWAEAEALFQDYDRVASQIVSIYGQGNHNFDGS
jgi:hypothetical protein